MRGRAGTREPASPLAVGEPWFAGDRTASLRPMPNSEDVTAMALEQIQGLERVFQRLYGDALGQVVEGDGAYHGVVSALAAIDALGKYWLGPNAGSGDRFRRFVCQFFPPRYRPHAGALWDLRRGVIHAMAVKRFHLTRDLPVEEHLEFRSDGVPVLVPKVLHQDLLQAGGTYFAKARRDAKLQQLLSAALRDEGGMTRIGSVPPHPGEVQRRVIGAEASGTSCPEPETTWTASSPPPSTPPR